MINTIKKNISGLVAAVAVAQIVDHVWFSGVLPWQSAVAEREITLAIIKNLLLAVASFVIYDMLYHGDEHRDIFEFAGLFTCMNLALDDQPLTTNTHELKELALNGVHRFVLLYALIFTAHYVKAHTRRNF